MSDAAKNLEEFFDYIWGDTEGLVYTPTLDKDVIGQVMYNWPAQKEAVVLHTLRAVAEGKDAFFSPALYKQGPPRKENVLGTHVLWADFDGAIPDSFDSIPAPSLEVISSTEDRRHYYWKLDEFLTDVKKIEDSNRAIAYTFGADTSGWDATQFLRPPETINQGHRKEREPMPVKLGSGYGKAEKLEAFNLAPPKATVNENIDLEEIPKVDSLIALFKWPEDMWDLFRKPVDQVSDRSAGLQRLAYHGAEIGMSDEGIFAILHNADERWRKYADRHDQRFRLIDCINKARAKIGYNFDDDSVIDALVATASGEEIIEPSKNILFTFDDFLKEKYEFEWMLEGLLATKGLGVVTGAPGTGKTQLLMQFAASIATGTDFLQWPIRVNPKKVLLLSLEMAGEALQLFYKKNVGAYSDRERELLNKNLRIAPIGFPVPFNEEGGQKFIDSLMSAVHPEVVFIDSLSQVISGSISDEVEVKELLWFINKHIREKFGAAVVFVHHNRKEGTNSHIGGGSDLDDIYGNRFLTAGLDFGLSLRKTHQPGTLILSHVKSRLAQEAQQVTLKRTDYLTYDITDSTRPEPHPTYFGRDSSDEPSVRRGPEEGDSFSLSTGG